MFKVNNKDTKATPMEEIFKSQVKTFREPCQNKRVQHIVLFCFTRLFFFFFAISCLQLDISIARIIMNDKKGTGSINSLENRENLNSKIYWKKEQRKISITSHVVNAKLAGISNILVLSTMSPLLLGVTKDEGKKKPDINQIMRFVTSLTRECQDEVYH